MDRVYARLCAIVDRENPCGRLWRIRGDPALRAVSSIPAGLSASPCFAAACQRHSLEGVAWPTVAPAGSLARGGRGRQKSRPVALAAGSPVPAHITRDMDKLERAAQTLRGAAATQVHGSAFDATGPDGGGGCSGCHRPHRGRGRCDRHGWPSSAGQSEPKRRLASSARLAPV